MIIEDGVTLDQVGDVAKVIRLIRWETLVDHKINFIKRGATDEVADVVVEGTYDNNGNTVHFGGWLPLLAVKHLLLWSARNVAEMTDYPEMAMDGDWSGVRDTSSEKIKAIYKKFIIPKLFGV